MRVITKQHACILHDVIADEINGLRGCLNGMRTAREYCKSGASLGVLEYAIDCAQLRLDALTYLASTFPEDLFNEFGDVCGDEFCSIIESACDALRNECDFVCSMQSRETTGLPEIERVKYSIPATIVFWSDKTKTVVKCQDGDTWDAEKGLMAAMLKKLFGNNSAYNDVINRWVKDAPTTPIDEPIAEPTIEPVVKYDGCENSAVECVYDESTPVSHKSAKYEVAADTSVQDVVVEALSVSKHGLTVPQIASECNISMQSARYALNRLTKKDIVSSSVGLKAHKAGRAPLVYKLK